MRIARTRLVSIACLVLAAIAAAPAGAAPGDTTLVNRSSMGSGDAYGAVASSISGDGRFVVFSSDDERYVRYDDNQRSDVFLRDVATGTTTLVSEGTHGVGDHESHSGVISRDGNWVAFVSRASDLEDERDPDVDRLDVFLWHRTTGDLRKLSPDTALDPSISADGSRVVFDVNGEDPWLYDRATNTSTPLRGARERECEMPAISGDGRWAAFTCDDDPDGGYVPLLLRDLTTGVETALEPGPDVWVLFPSLSHDGRYIAWSTHAPIAPGDTTSDFDVVLRDRVTGATELVSKDLDAPVQVRGGVEGAELSDDGRYVAFRSFQAQGTPCCSTSVVLDRVTGTYEVAGRASGAGGRVVEADLGLDGLSADGRFAVFSSPDQRLDPAKPASAPWAVYRRELGTEAAGTPLAEGQSAPREEPAPTASGLAPTPVTTLSRAAVAMPSLVRVSALRLGTRVVRRRTGTTLSLVVSQATTVRIRIDRSVACRRSRRCRTWKPARTSTARAPRAGRLTVRIGRGLPRGAYRVSVAVAGGPASRATFRVR